MEPLQVGAGCINDKVENMDDLLGDNKLEFAHAILLTCFSYWILGLFVNVNDRHFSLSHICPKF